MKISIAGHDFNVAHSDEMPDVDWKWVAENYEPKTFYIISKLLSRDDCALEVGIDSGQTTLVTAAYAGEMVAIEPSIKSCSYINFILNLNPTLKPKVEVINGALSDVDRHEIFGPNQKLFDDIHFNDTQSSTLVEGYTIEKLESSTSKKFDFVNMDIEGGEFIVLPAMQKWLRERKPILLLSLHPGFLLSDVQKNQPKWIRYLRRYIEQIKIFKAIKSYDFIYSVESNKRIKSIEIFRLKFVRSKSGQYSQILCSTYDVGVKLDWV